MTRTAPVRTPFFEIGIKNYLYGDAVIELAHAADEAARAHDLDVLFIAPLLELRRVCESTRDLIVIAPHMDLIEPGRGLTKVLPEGLKAAGVAGVVFNHVEHPQTLSEVRQGIERAHALDLLSFVCADTIQEAVALASFGPDIINPEPAERIGGTDGVPIDFAIESTASIRAVSTRVLVEQAAGVTTPDDVFELVLAGADGVGAASGIAAAADPLGAGRAMIAAMAEARALRARNAHSRTQEAINYR